jgi:hypothetical protein
MTNYDDPDPESIKVTDPACSGILVTSMNVAKQKDKAYVLDIYLRKLIGFHGQKVSYCNCWCHHCSKSNGWIVFKNK